MTVRDAAQSILALTGAQNISTCREGTGGYSIAIAALAALNRAMQEIWAAPTSRAMTLETVSVTFPSAAAVDLASNVLNVVGPVRWNGYQPVPLVATETDFQNYFGEYSDHHFDNALWDDLVFGSSHDVTGSLPWYDVEFYLPLWDDRAVLVYFDNADDISTLDAESATSPQGNALNSRTILVRVELPHEDTTAAAGRALVLRELTKKAGQFLECIDDPTGGSIRCFRRRAADVTDWTLSDVTSVDLSVTKGPRIPLVAWAESLKATTGEDLARVRLHLLPAAAGTVTLKVTKEPTKYVFADLDVDGDGISSTVIGIAHGWAESLVLPLARHAFAQDCPAWLTPQVIESLPALEAAAQTAKETMGLAAPNSSQNMQRNQSTRHAHP